MVVMVPNGKRFVNLSFALEESGRSFGFNNGVLMAVTWGWRMEMKMEIVGENSFLWIESRIQLKSFL